MSNKNPATEEKNDLKHADMEKSGNEVLDTQGTDNSEYLRSEKRAKSKQKIRGEVSVEKKRSRKISLAVDIIVAIVIILAIAGLITGAYFAFRYYSDIRYKDAHVEYTALIEDDFLSDEDISALRNKEVYLDADDNSFYLGKIIGTNKVETGDGKYQLSLQIDSDAKYKKGEGFSINGKRIAVGCEYTLRYESESFDIAIVEMHYKGVGK